jgi:hypothetical protein
LRTNVARRLGPAAPVEGAQKAPRDDQTPEPDRTSFFCIGLEGNKIHVCRSPTVTFSDSAAIAVPTTQNRFSFDLNLPSLQQRNGNFRRTQGKTLNFSSTKQTALER